ncbi:MAG: sigma-54 dependent transcriptional regulator [Nitrospiraceae bacterium]|nr:sigma-54 dependent transcriptional regulator [Nitrospiraceae bacterium]
MNKDRFRILVVDDEKSFLRLVSNILEDAGHEVRGFDDPGQALGSIGSFNPHLVITDLKMPEMDGIRFMNEVRQRNSGTEFIMITAFATVDTAVEAMKQGAADYITKPLRDPAQLRAAVEKVCGRRITPDKKSQQAGSGNELPPVAVIFAGMEQTLETIGDVAPTEATVILSGETGTGKSLIAKVIHQMSGRTGPFVDINCAAIPENLLESELFGYEKGAFTGALSQKKGRFELAQDGTIFLDEVSEMSLILQAKLLKVLQERSFERLGALGTIRTNARIIAATNRNLKDLVEEKRFREDLYYRLSVFPVRIPPLRERIDKIARITNHLLKVMTDRLGREEAFITEEDISAMKAYPWPGNIRELENAIERAMISSKGNRLILPLSDNRTGSPGKQGSGKSDLKSIERTAIENALIRAGGNRRRAAGILGISLRSLQYKIKDYGISGRQEETGTLE